MQAEAKAERGLTGRLATLRRALNRREPADLAAACGADFDGECVVIKMWDRPVSLGPPAWTAVDLATGADLDLMSQALLIYYLYSCDGTPAAGTWIAFTELPDGRFYTQAFQSYTGQRLAGRFGNDLATFRAAALELGATPAPLADAAFRLQVLPFVPVLIVCWQGDEDFAPSYRLLFDAHVAHQLPTDACAVLGSQITGRLLSVAEAL